MRRKIGITAAAMLLAGTIGLLGCASTEETLEETQQIVTIQVENADGFGVSNIQVTAWIVDVDLPLDRRTPIQVGPAPTDAGGTVRFTHPATTQPYVCGFEIAEPVSKAVVAAHVADVANSLSDTAGQLTIRI